MTTFRDIYLGILWLRKTNLVINQINLEIKIKSYVLKIRDTIVRKIYRDLYFCERVETKYLLSNIRREYRRFKKILLESKRELLLPEYLVDNYKIVLTNKVDL